MQEIVYYIYLRVITYRPNIGLSFNRFMHMEFEFHIINRTFYLARPPFAKSIVYLHRNFSTIDLPSALIGLI